MTIKFLLIHSPPYNATRLVQMRTLQKRSEKKFVFVERWMQCLLLRQKSRQKSHVLALVDEFFFLFLG